MNAQAAHSLSSLERFPSRLATRVAENHFSHTMACLRAMDEVEFLRAVSEATKDERFCDYDVRYTAMVDRGLDHMLTAAEGDRSVGGWAI